MKVGNSPTLRLMKSITKRKRVQYAARYGLWDAWDGRCYWCEEPIRPFADCEIDHVIPLDAVRSAGAEELRRLYNLPSDFDFNGFANCVPTHRRCNRKKGSLPLGPSPAVSMHLEVIRMKARVAQAISEKIQSDKRKDAVLARLGTLIEAGTLTQPELEDFLASLPRTIKKAADLPDVHLFIAPNWEVIRSGDGRSVRVSPIPQAGNAISSTSWRNW
jgi:hypothetical protein